MLELHFTNLASNVHEGDHVLREGQGFPAQVSHPTRYS
jgi:hypothetical protein